MQRRWHAISEPHQPEYWQHDGRNRATDDNGCRWEWKFSLDADRCPELWCRCETCGVKYYLSSWQWTLGSDWETKCRPPIGKDRREIPKAEDGKTLRPDSAWLNAPQPGDADAAPLSRAGRNSYSGNPPERFCGQQHPNAAKRTNGVRSVPE